MPRTIKPSKHDRRRAKKIARKREKKKIRAHKQQLLALFTHALTSRDNLPVYEIPGRANYLLDEYWKRYKRISKE